MTNRCIRAARAVALPALLAALASCGTVSRPLWNKFRTNLANAGRAQADTAGGHVRWTILLDTWPGCPVLWSDATHKTYKDSRIIMGTGLSNVRSVLPLQGKLDWAFAMAQPIMSCPAAPADEKAIFVTSSYGTVISLPVGFLSPYWVRDLAPNMVLTSPTAWGDFVYVGGGNRLYVLKKDDGTTAWAYDLGAPIVVVSAPAVTLETRNAVVVVAENGAVAKLDAFDGAILWKVQLRDAVVVESLALGSDSTVFVASNSGIHALDAKDGHTRWQFPTAAGKHVSAPAVLHVQGADRVYFVDSDAHLIALQGSSGQELWRVTLPDAASVAPVMTPNEIAYVGVGKGSSAQLVARGPSGAGWAVPVAGTVTHIAVGEDGAIYVVAGQSLHAID